MLSRSFVLVLGVSLLSVPILTQASTCSELANTINTDIKQHPNDLAKQNFPWKRLEWLKKTLGVASPGMPLPGQVQYQWECTDEEDSTITLVADATTKRLEIKGKYNQGEEGAGMFFACLNCVNGEVVAPVATQPNTSVVEAAVPNTPLAPTTQVAVVKPAAGPMALADVAITSLPVVPVISKSAAKTAKSKAIAAASRSSAPGRLVATMPKPITTTVAVDCSDVTKQMYEVANAPIPKSAPQYAWENPRWLEKQFGKPILHKDKEGKVFKWSCSGSNMVWNKKISNDQITSRAVYCSQSLCYQVSLVRVKNELQGKVIKSVDADKADELS